MIRLISFVIINLIVHIFYVKYLDDEIILIVLYVDVWFSLIIGLKSKLKATFEMMDFNLLHFFIGIQVLQLDDDIFISHYK